MVTSGNLVPAGPERLDEAEAIDGHHYFFEQDDQLLMLHTKHLG